MPESRALPDWVDNFEFPFDELSLAEARAQTGAFAHETSRVRLDVFAAGAARIRFDRCGDWLIEAILIDSHPDDWRVNPSRPRVRLDPIEPLFPIVKAALVAEFDAEIERRASERAAEMRLASRDGFGP